MAERSRAWSESLALIEEQHEGLQAATSRFLNAAGQHLGQGELYDCLDDLLSNLEKHFISEEQIMSRVGYAGLHAHRLLHQACLDQLRCEKEHLALGQLRSRSVYEEMLRTWITDHLHTQDRRFIDFLDRVEDATP
jgi:hemerythrin-like metal-binding protein